ncbi:hypothetical protein [Mucilaginibacter sp.]
MKKQGHCQICGLYGELTFEHVPPRGAFNDRPIFIQVSDHLIETSGPLFGKRSQSHRGQGVYSLCKSCSNNTGAWYGKDYCDFARQGMPLLKAQIQQGYVKGQYRLKPLNVFKQIISMFLSADKIGYIRSHQEMVEFMLNKYSTEFPSKFKVYIYSNHSPNKRVMGYSVGYDEALGIVKWSEINFQPFGYLLTEESPPAHPQMVDITKFSCIPYDTVCDVTLATIYLPVNSMWIGSYGL